MSEMLKSCPVPHERGRGGKLEIVGPKPNYHWSAWVKCPCGVRGPACNTREEAIVAWNNLTALASKDAEIRVLRDALNCWPLQRIISYAQNFNPKMALLFEEVRAAALAPAPEGKEQP